MVAWSGAQREEEATGEARSPAHRKALTRETAGVVGSVLGRALAHKDMVRSNSGCLEEDGMAWRSGSP
jgi:hypothetical protein